MNYDEVREKKEIHVYSSCKIDEEFYHSSPSYSIERLKDKDREVPITKRTSTEQVTD